MDEQSNMTDAPPAVGCMPLLGVAQLGAAHPTLTSRSDKYGTPRKLFQWLDREFCFETDVCATDGNAMCPNYYTPETDGLAQVWQGVCWMNPPYGKEIGKWMQKAYESSLQGATIVCLVPARTDAGWFHKWVLNKAEIRFLRGRLTFRAFGGVGKAHGQQAPFASLIVIYRPPTKDT